MRAKILAFAALFAFWIPASAGELRLRYDIHVVPGASQIPITVEIAGISTDALLLRLTDNYGGIPDSNDLLRDIEVVDGRFERTTDSYIKVPTAGKAEITVRYNVVVEGRERDRGRTLPELDHSHAFIPGASTFVYPETQQPIGEIRIRFRKPIDWKIATTWGVGYDEYAFRSKHVNDLIYSVAVLGDYRLLTRHFGGIPIHGAFRGTGKSSDSEVLDLLLQVLSAHRQTFQTVPFKRLLAVGNFRYDNGATAGNAFHNSINLLMPTDRTLQEHAGFRSLVAHESFHLWNGGDGVLAYAEYDVLWLSEGVTDYYAQKNLLRAGVITETEMLDDIAGKYLRLQSSALREMPVTAAGYLYFDDNRARNLVYMKGAIAAFALDMHIQLASARKKSFDTLLRVLANRRNNAERGEQYNQADVLSAMREVGGTELLTVFASLAAEYRDTFERILMRAGYSLDRVDQEGYTLGLFDIGRAREQLRIRALDLDGPAFLAGLQEGDIITELDGTRVSTSGEFQRKMKTVTNGTGKQVVVVVNRNSEAIQFTITPQRFYRYVIRRP